jgi:tRNA-uridine 2-sulfurtransferase
VAADASWIAGRAPPAGLLAAKTRYRQTDSACTFEAALAADVDGDTTTASAFRLRFEQPQWAVTPGQSAVLYAGDVCLGGGVIGAAD